MSESEQQERFAGREGWHSASMYPGVCVLVNPNGYHLFKVITQLDKLQTFQTRDDLMENLNSRSREISAPREIPTTSADVTITGLPND